MVRNHKMFFIENSVNKINTSLLGLPKLFCGQSSDRARGGLKPLFAVPLTAAMKFMPAKMLFYFIKPFAYPPS